MGTENRARQNYQDRQSSRGQDRRRSSSRGSIFGRDRMRSSGRNCEGSYRDRSQSINQGQSNSKGRRDDRDQRHPPGDFSKYIGCHCKDCETMRKHAKTVAGKYQGE